jgi:hypothetical protein
MAASIGNTTFGTSAGGGVAHNNNGSTIVVFLHNESAARTVADVAYGGESMEPEIVTRISDCRGYAFILENAPSGSNQLTFTPSADTWYHAIYSIVDGGEKGDHNSDVVSQQSGSNCRAPVSTQDANSVVVASIIRRYTTAAMTPQNMTEDDQRTFHDGRAAAGHAQGTGGSVDLWWNWASTENAVLIAVEVLEKAVIKDQSMSSWFW